MLHRKLGIKSLPKSSNISRPQPSLLKVTFHSQLFTLYLIFNDKVKKDNFIIYKNIVYSQNILEVIENIKYLWFVFAMWEFFCNNSIKLL